MPLRSRRSSTNANAGAHGIAWTSHQADTGDASILWASRLDPLSVAVLEGPVRIDEPPAGTLAQRACERLGVLLVA
jgi:hypothetical protein